MEAFRRSVQRILGISECRVSGQINTGNLRKETFGKLGGEGNGLALAVERGADVEGM